MSLNTAIFSYLQDQAAITNLIGARLYPEVNPSQTRTLPYVTWEKTSNTHIHHTLAAAGLAMPRYEFTVWAATALSAEAIADALRGELDGFQHTAMGDDSLDVRGITLETEDSGMVQLPNKDWVFTVRLDFIIRHAESVPTF